MTEGSKYTREVAGYVSQVGSKLAELRQWKERFRGGGVHTPGLDANIATLRLVETVARAIEGGSPIMVGLGKDELGGVERLLAIRRDRVTEESVILHIPFDMVVTAGDAHRMRLAETQGSVVDSDVTHGFTDCLYDPPTVLAPSMNLGEMQLGEDGERTLDCD